MFKNSTETKEIVDEVLTKVYDAVIATMGPNGRLVAINQGTGSPKVTKDGVTVARTIKFASPEMEMVNNIITEPAIKTDIECGDGTTTTIFLTYHLKKLFDKYPGFLDRIFIKKIFKEVIESLETNSIKVEAASDLFYKLALTSSNQDTSIADTVVKLFRDSGDRFPEVELKKNSDLEDVINKVDGVIIRASYADPMFSPQLNGSEGTFNDFRIMVIDSDLGLISKEQGMSILERLTSGEGDLVVIARTFSNEAITSFVNINQHCALNLKQNKKIICLKTGFGGGLGSLISQDISGIFGEPSAKDLDIALASGSGTEVKQGTELVCDNRRSILTYDNGSVDERISKIIAGIKEEQAKYMVGERNSPRSRFNDERIRNLESSVITLYVGGHTTSDVNERIDRYEDVVKACKSALIQGILPGQGTGLLLTAAELARTYMNIPKEELVNKKISKDDIVTTTLSSREKDILLEILGLLAQQRAYLAKDFMEEGKLLNPFILYNLATNETESIEETSVFDTGYASIVALKGGLSTAEILSDLSCLIMGTKMGSVTLSK